MVLLDEEGNQGGVQSQQEPVVMDEPAAGQHRRYWMLASVMAFCVVLAALFLGSGSPIFDKLESLWESNLGRVASNLSKLQGLSEVHNKSEVVHEKLYLELLTQPYDHADHAEAKEWNNFVKAAEETAPIYRKGKDSLRTAIARMRVLIQRGPHHLRSFLFYWKSNDLDEADYYLQKVIHLVANVQSYIDRSVEHFDQVRASIETLSEELSHLQRIPQTTPSI